jgi:hypothetical protein
MLPAGRAERPVALVCGRATKDVWSRTSECSCECATRISRCARRRSSPSVFFVPETNKICAPAIARSLVATLHVQSRQFRSGDMRGDCRVQNLEVLRPIRWVSASSLDAGELNSLAGRGIV